MSFLKELFYPSVVRVKRNGVDGGAISLLFRFFNVLNPGLLPVTFKYTSNISNNKNPLVNHHIDSASDEHFHPRKTTFLSPNDELF